MEEYQKRVLEEKEQLVIKIVKIQCFQATDKFKDLQSDEVVLLNRQLDYMQEYAVILAERIELF